MPQHESLQVYLVGSSRRHLAAILLVSLGTPLLILFLPIPLLITKVAAVLSVLLNGVWQLYLWHDYRNRPWAIEVKWGVEFTTARGGETPGAMVLLSGSTLLSWLLILQFRDAGKRRRSIIVFGDSLQTGSLRRLRLAAENALIYGKNQGV